MKGVPGEEIRGFLVGERVFCARLYRPRSNRNITGERGINERSRSTGGDFISF